MNSVKKLLSYANSKHNILALVFVLVVLLVAQHPNLFSRQINSVWGKLIVLLIVILLTHYNIIVGLIATISIIGLYIYLHDSGYEGFENATVKPDPSASVASTGKTEPATVTATGEEKDTAVTNVLAPAPVDKPKNKPVTPPSVATPPAANMVDKQLSAADQVKSIPSGHIPVSKGKSDAVEAFSPLHGTLNASFIKK